MARSSSRAADDAALWARADRHLVRYGHYFQPVIIDKAHGRLHDDHRRPAHPRLRLGTDEHDSRPQPSRDHGRDPRAGRRSRAPLQPAAVAAGDRSREALAKLAPGELSRVLLLSTGGESNEAALRMAKTATGSYEILALSRSWHGVTQGGRLRRPTSAAGEGYGPAPPGSFVLPAPTPYRPHFSTGDTYDWEAELDYGFELFDRQSTGNPAALILESILSSGGVIVPPKGYLKAAGRAGAGSVACWSSSTRRRRVSAGRDTCSIASTTGWCRIS